MKKIVRSHALSKLKSKYSLSLGEIKIQDEKVSVWYFSIEDELIIKRNNEWIIKKNN